MIKKIALLILLNIVISDSALALPYPDLRTKGLISLGLVLSAAGAYQLIKRSESAMKFLTDVGSGIILLAAGITTIVLSAQLIHEIDNSFK